MYVFFASVSISIRRHLRNITPFIMQVIGPLVMIIILASVMQGNFRASSFFSPVNTVVVNNDSNGQAAQNFIAFLNNSDMKKLIKVTVLQNINNAEQQLREGKFDAVIEISSDYNKNIETGDFSGIKTFLISNDKTSYQIISSILNSWNNNSAAIQIALKSGKTMNQITQDLNSSNKIVEDMPLTSNGSLPKSIDYYSVTIAVMTLMFTGVLSLDRIQRDFLSGMKNRFLMTSSRLGTIMSGEIIGITLMAFLQSVIVVIFTHFVYGANWGSNIVLTLGILFIMTFFSQMLASVLAIAMNNANAAQGIISTLAMGFCFISGGFYTNPFGGLVGRFLSTYGTPSSLAQTAIFGNIYGGSMQVIFLCMGILSGLSLILLGFAVLLAKRRIL